MNLLRSLALLSALAVTAIVTAQSVSYNGTTLVWDDSRPYNSGGTIMLPARDTMDRIGGLLERNDSGKRIDLLWNSNRASFRQGDRYFTMAGRRYNLPTTSQAQRGVLYLPLEIYSKVTNGALRQGGGGRKPDQGNQIFFDGEKVKMPGWERVYRKQGVLMVPFRDFGKAIGADTDRSANGKTITIKFDGDRILYQVGSDFYYYNNKKVELSTTSDNRNDVLYVPITMYRSVTRGRITLNSR